MSENYLNLSGSLQSHLNKAEKILIYLEEDWEALAPFSCDKTLPQTFREMYTRARDLLNRHRTVMTVDTPDKRERREILTRGKELYQELRTCFLFHFPDDERTRMIKKKYPHAPTNPKLPMGLLLFIDCFEKEDERPGFVTDELLSEAYASYQKVIDVLPDFQLRRYDQKALRRERDEAFRELLAIQKMVKETGRFAFRNDREMKKRYR